MERGWVRTIFSWGSVRKESNFEDLSVDGRLILKLIYKK
jgi:hypothetical protein